MLQHSKALGAKTHRNHRRTNMLLAIVRFLQDYRDFNRNLQELSRLNDRELSDIGITRADIPRVAAAGFAKR
jgi:uncharacterized protein YjiS (DUF1127 family)